MQATYLVSSAQGNIFPWYFLQPANSFLLGNHRMRDSRLFYCCLNTPEHSKWTPLRYEMPFCSTLTTTTRMQCAYDVIVQMCYWLYSPRRNLRLFMWSSSTWYLIKPPWEKVFLQHLMVSGHFVLTSTYFLLSSFFFFPPMTCLFLAESFGNLSTVLENWSFCSSMSVSAASSAIVPTSFPLPSAWHDRSSTFWGTLALYFVEC